MVAKFWISTNRGPVNIAEKKLTCTTFSSIIASRNRGTKTIVHTYLSSFDNGKLSTYPSLNLTLTLPSFLGQNGSLGEG